MHGYRETDTGYVAPVKRARPLTRWEWTGLAYGVVANLLLLARALGLLASAPAWVQSHAFTGLLVAAFWLVWAGSMYERARANRDDEPFKAKSLKQGAAFLALISLSLIAMNIYDLTQGAN